MKTTIQDVAGMVGFSLLAVGLLGYDWRVAFVVCGTLVLVGALMGIAEQ